MPSQVWIAGLIAAVFIVGFFAAVVPLLVSGGHNPRAELSGQFPDRISLGERFVLPLALDNTSSSIIAPVCIEARLDPASGTRATEAIFQGLETVAFRDGRACGGSLSGGEVINVRLVLAPLRTGLVRLSLTPAQGTSAIGPALRGSLEVVP